MNENTNPRQVDKVLARLRKGPLTQLEALTELGIMRLGARVLELRREGFAITTERVDVATRVPGETANIARYRLQECQHTWEDQPDGWATQRCSTCELVTLKTPTERAA